MIEIDLASLGIGAIAGLLVAGLLRRLWRWMEGYQSEWDD